MNATVSIVLLGALALALPLAVQQTPSADRRTGAGLGMLPAQVVAPASRVMTDDEFRALRTAQYGGEDGLKAMPPKKHGLSLAEMSLFLSFGEKSTLLPKGSILWSPDALRSRVVSLPPTPVIPWVDFFTANRNWVATCEVDLKQVRGEKPLPDNLLQSYKLRGVMVVATLNGNPVTVLPYSAANVSK